MNEGEEMEVAESLPRMPCGETPKEWKLKAVVYKRVIFRERRV